MRRNERLSIKKERMEPSTSTTRAAEEDHDLAYFIHDRVELMRQVFCALTPKEIKAMAPAAVRKHSNDDLEELCLEELLGISSKRLCAVLDGAEPPTDTESSSDSDCQELVTIELDSSDDGSKRSGPSCKNKKKKRDAKNKRKSTETQVDDARTRDSRDDDARGGGGGAGVTVLELLELQARARALKAQLRATESRAAAPADPSPDSDVAEVKEEETPLVVEISSDEDQKPALECQEKGAIEPTTQKPATTNKKKNSGDATAHALNSLIEKIANIGNTNTTTTKKNNNAQSAEIVNKTKEKPKEKKDSNKNITKETAVQDKNLFVNKGTDKSDDLRNDKSKDNTVSVEVTTNKKAKTAKSGKEKEGTSKKKSSKKNKKSTDKTDSEDVAKKNVEPPVEAKVEPDETIVIEDDEPEPPIQKSPIRPPSPSISSDTNDFTIYVPQQVNTKRRIQLERNNVVISLSTVQTPERDARVASTVASVKKLSSSVKKVQRQRPVTPEMPKLNSVVVRKEKETKEKKIRKKKAKDKKRKQSVEDRDEITLQLSDSEKMDLLEDLDKSGLDKATSSSAGSTECESDDDGQDQGDKVSDGDEVSSTVPTQMDEASNVEEKVDEIHNKEIEEDMVDSGENTKEVDAVNVIQKADKDRPSDTAIDSTTNENDITENNVSNEDVGVKDSSDEESNASSENESQKPTENVLINMDEINKQNININDGDTIEVSCINDIPIIPDDYNLKLPETFQDTTPESDDDDETDSSSDSSDSIDDASDERSSSDEEAETTGTLQQHDSGNDAQLNLSEKDNADEDNMCTEKSDDEKVEETVKSDNKSDKEIGKSVRSQRAPSEEGELSDKSSSEVEAFEMKSTVVCISDDDGDAQHPTTRKKKKTSKKKKDKKCKKHKKTDDRNTRDENVYKDADKLPVLVEDGKIDVVLQIEEKQTPKSTKNVEMAPADAETPQVTIGSDDMYEILELSDDSSCYEVEGVNVLSKEPTSEEIVALSAKIDEIEDRRVVVTDQEIIEHEQQISTKESAKSNIENVSWKDRYLDSKKVKKVLTTSNILNAMRKKNIELKKKMSEAKNKEAELKAKEKEIEPEETPKEIPVEEGSIEHYNTLEGSNKYVDPVPEKPDISDKEGEATENTEKSLDKTETENSEKVSDTVNKNEQSGNILKAKESQRTVTKEMKKDAKQLLKMYKRLLKYNDMNKPKDPNKKKKNKKQKKKKDGGNVCVAACGNT